MTYIAFIIISSVFIILLFAYLVFISDIKKETNRITASIMILIVAIYGASLYYDIKTTKTQCYNFIEEYVAAKAIIETEIQNKTIFSNNEQLIDRAINYNIELATYQARAQRKNIINIVPKEIMDLEPIQIRDGYDIKWVIG